jgi:cytidyltransferase-like protein
VSVYIFTGRFQPLHKGHISFLENVKMCHPDSTLLICIIRQTTQPQPFASNSSFNKESIMKHHPQNNPLPNWNRYMLLSLAVKSNHFLRENTEIIFRNRSDIDWDESVQDLPKDRIWLLPKYAKEPFDLEKQKYYQSKNERIETIDLYNKEEDYSASNIRRQLRKYRENADLSFLPKACREYFRLECLPFFIN